MDQPDSSVFRHEAKLHIASLAKKAAAFLECPLYPELRHFLPQPLNLSLFPLHHPINRKGRLQVLRHLPYPFPQNVLMHLQVSTRLHHRRATLLDQLDILNLKFLAELPSGFHCLPPISIVTPYLGVFELGVFETGSSPQARRQSQRTSASCHGTASSSASMRHAYQSHAVEAPALRYPDRLVRLSSQFFLIRRGTFARTIFSLASDKEEDIHGIRLLLRQDHCQFAPQVHLPPPLAPDAPSPQSSRWGHSQKLAVPVLVALPRHH